MYAYVDMNYDPADLPKVLIYTMSGFHKFSGDLQIALSCCLNKQTTGKELPHGWLERLDIDLTTLCYLCMKH